MNNEKKISEDKILTEEEAQMVNGGEALQDDSQIDRDELDFIRTHHKAIKEEIAK